MQEVKKNIIDKLAKLQRQGTLRKNTLWKKNVGKCTLDPTPQFDQPLTLDNLTNDQALIA